MADVGVIAGVLSALKSAVDVTESMVALRDRTAVEAKTVELHAIIIAAQNAAITAQKEHSALIDEVSGLKAEVARLKAWDREKEKHTLHSVYPGARAYVLKPDAAEAEEAHWLCTACYEKGQKGVFQLHETQGSWRVWRCPLCKSDIKTGRHVAPEDPFVPAKPSGDA